MTKDELHKYIEESKGNESNICQICAYKDGRMVLRNVNAEFMDILEMTGFTDFLEIEN